MFIQSLTLLIINMYSITNYDIFSLFSAHRSDEEDPSGSKYNRMDDDSIQDKERFARYGFYSLSTILRSIETCSCDALCVACVKLQIIA